MSAPKPKPWFHGLICHNYGRAVLVSDRTVGASFHRTDGVCWAEHRVCPPPKGKR